MSKNSKSKLVTKIVAAVFILLLSLTVLQLIEFEKPVEEEARFSPPERSSKKEEPFQEFADTEEEEQIEKEVLETLAALDEPDSPKKRPPTSAEMPFATPVPGDPLVVKLPGEFASLGQISVEKYDNEGNPTGQPLKRGTQVQIPNPNKPGEKIYFKVP